MIDKARPKAVAMDMGWGVPHPIISMRTKDLCLRALDTDPVIHKFESVR